MKHLRNGLLAATLALAVLGLAPVVQAQTAVQPDEHFTFMDKNKDGVVDKQEFATMFGADSAKQFDAADTNHDGKLTPEEWQASQHSGMKMDGHGM